MKIKKQNDKPLVIHTKEKAKLHIKQPKEATIKADGINHHLPRLSLFYC